MSETISATVGKLHEPLRQSLAARRGAVIGNREARALLIQRFPELASQAQWVFLSDHRIEQAVKGSCQCARTAEALVKHESRGRYRVL